MNFNIICQVQKKPLLFFTSSKRQDLTSQPQQNRNKLRRMRGWGPPEVGRLVAVEGTANREVADRVMKIHEKETQEL